MADLPPYDVNKIRVREGNQVKDHTNFPDNFELGDDSDEAWRSFRKMILDEYNMDITGVATQGAWAVDDFYRMIAELDRFNKLKRWRERPRNNDSSHK